ncbi:E3 ubiquitin-protein ligase makorin [Zea mays]|uniref:E3 ubiquitin-protein ligase makorin n=1 Tax=Zea mays TaxID=4577 RepID=A0A1D6HIE8_MAIZE|nr:E3 ubiquitin-protein ligase makorin [Zea mays]
MRKFGKEALSQCYLDILVHVLRQRTPVHHLRPQQDGLKQKQRRLPTQSGGNMVPAFQASLRRAQFTLLPEIPPLAMPRRWGPNSHSASLPFLGKPIPRFGAHHKADLRKREEDERDRTKLRAAPTDQTLGVRRASPRRRRKGASRRLGVPEVVDGAARSASSSMSRRVPCKFFLHGACFKGDYCEFSHDCNDQPDNVTYVLLTPDQFPCTIQFKFALSSIPVFLRVMLSPTDDTTSWPLHQAVQNQTSQYPVHLPICSSTADGTCPYGKGCSQMHGDLCAFCERQCMNPYQSDERGVHVKLCKKNNRVLEAMRRSEDIECGVCLDRVLSKPTAAERRFGLLSDCDHSFCISCIRNWRSTSPTSGMDVNSTLRACPICRKLSYYVVPSITWYSSKEEKQEIVEGYKAKLRSIDCKHFDFGKGTCPFGSSCFYKVHSTVFGVI